MPLQNISLMYICHGLSGIFEIQVVIPIRDDADKLGFWKTVSECRSNRAIYIQGMSLFSSYYSVGQQVHFAQLEYICSSSHRNWFILSFEKACLVDCEEKTIES